MNFLIQEGEKCSLHSVGVVKQETKPRANLHEKHYLDLLQLKKEVGWVYPQSTSRNWMQKKTNSTVPNLNPQKSAQQLNIPTELCWNDLPGGTALLKKTTTKHFIHGVSCQSSLNAMTTLNFIISPETCIKFNMFQNDGSDLKFCICEDAMRMMSTPSPFHLYAFLFLWHSDTYKISALRGLHSFENYS